MKKVKITAKSSLRIESDCILEDINLDGDLEIRTEGQVIQNHQGKDYYTIGELEGNEEAYLKIRGYKLIPPKKL